MPSNDAAAPAASQSSPRKKGMNPWLRGIIGNVGGLGVLYTVSHLLDLQGYAMISLGIQWAVFLGHGLPYSSEKYYDASGSLTHFVLVVVSLLIKPNRSRRQILLGVCSIVWMTRLGSFLFTRIMKDGKDGRFDSLKKNFLRFATAWTVQALWVFLIQLPVLVVGDQDVDAGGDAFGILDVVGFGAFVFGFFFEVIADAQKTAFRGNSANKDKFITTGLWALSRHPNYFGEIVMWVGVTLAATTSLSTPLQYLAWLSPIFTVVLLTKVSGVPLLEHHGNKKWGSDPKYVEYMARTPCIIPALPGSKK